MIKTWNDFINVRNSGINNWDNEYHNVILRGLPLNVIDPYFQSKIVDKIFEVIGEISFRCLGGGSKTNKIVIKKPKTSCKSITYKHDNVHGWQFSAKFKTIDNKTFTAYDGINEIFDKHSNVNFTINDAFILLNEVYEMYKPVDLNSEI